MTSPRETWIDQFMGRLDIRQKIGQLLVFGFSGPVITPDIEDLVKNHHLGGLRISVGFRHMTLFNDVKPGTEPEDWTLRSLHAPVGVNRDCVRNTPPTVATAGQYAGVLNRLRQMSMDRPGGVPLHFTIDQEGSGSDDLLCNTRLFPHPMGLAASGDPDLAYRAAVAISRQARAVGANMIHSPVLDVNTNPLNPEIGTRAYSDQAEEVTRFALASLKGFNEHKLIATGKHFPGRGESMADAHWGLPLVDLPLDRLEAEHLSPYRALIAAGLPAIMMAHSLYPALGDSEEPASCSRHIIEHHLRGALNFGGVITTDNMMMGGLLQKYELREAVLKVLQAGNDLVLLRDESPIRWKIMDYLFEAVGDGRLPEAELDAKVMRILGMRWDMGLAEGGGLVDEGRADAAMVEPSLVKTCEEAARRSVLLLRDDAGVLPIKPGGRVLLVEQIFPTHLRANTMDCHPGLLWDELNRALPGTGSIEIGNVPTDEDRQRVRRRITDENPDLIVTTNYYYHKAASAISDLVGQMQETGKPVVVIANTPYPVAADPKFPTVVVCFNPGGRENLRAVCEVLTGTLKPTAKLPVSRLE